ncbi:protease SohB [Pseudoalteromonas luteoviolacea]|uniref:Peptidase n=1 Tax=Pseudoalteromonas luteoviolacea DSM 6061 TaxID=1365250 RepID=A0A166YX71_9GAMM|nr:protease SohB [Pseudoalteromonas luteoviolacea]KZN43604.1 peptidase [Pseudoalteromonas luteoviolacea DSM 6061]KZN53675.1 peptidase [Pseudoalteromonas luteoviolacea CPMOR-2]MBE0386514.1 serine protease SohB [Pseudoalteromonas luteoviolacea DSM 6061]TQF71381.1 protease SohB [Pseudoalteromonas luteoviolacea]
MAFLFEYGLFLAKAVTVVIAIGAIVILIVGASQKPKTKSGEIEIKDLSDELAQAKESFLHQTLDKKELKAHLKESKKAAEDKPQGQAFVIDFSGSLDAHEVASLREEVTAILTVANKEKDQVLVNLESGGGVVHGYGLAASQLIRLKQSGLPLTVCIDKVAASGGYMMACVADKIVAAPFAIVGSIGVIAQLPNFNKILKKNDVEFEQITAGEYKRTLTMFGENTDQGREKFKSEIEHTHTLFKQFVAEHRPGLDIDKVATGEHWFATHAKEFELVDEIKTSDDILLDLNNTHQLYKVKYKAKKALAERLGVGLSVAVEKLGVKVLSRLQSNKL